MAVLASAKAATRVTTLCKRRFFIVDRLSIRCVGYLLAPHLTGATRKSGSAATDLSSCARNIFLDLAADPEDLPQSETKQRAGSARIPRASPKRLAYADYGLASPPRILG